jgi:hypothetical protein
MPHAQPAREECTHKAEIVQALRALIEQVQTLHRRELEAIKQDDVAKLERLGEEIDKATALEASLMEKLQVHLKSHGCG